MKKYRVTVDGQSFTVQVEELARDQEPIAETGAPPAGPSPGRSTPEPPAAPDPGITASAAAALRVEAPMPGSIISVAVKPGDTIGEGAVLLVLEAMKMENEITAPRGGTIRAVHVRTGDTVGSGDLLVELV